MHICLSHWGRMMHICVSKIIIIGSNNGLTLGRRQAMNQFWNIVNWSFRHKLSKIVIEMHTFSFNKMHLKMSAKWSLFCLGLKIHQPMVMPFGITELDQHYLNLFWLFIDEVLWQSYGGNFTGNTLHIYITEICLKITIDLKATPPWGQWVY